MTSTDELLTEAEARSSAIWARRSGSAVDDAARDGDQYHQAFHAFICRGDADGLCGWSRRFATSGGRAGSTPKVWRGPTTS
jgi:hypothetical protein